MQKNLRIKKIKNIINRVDHANKNKTLENFVHSLKRHYMQHLILYCENSGRYIMKKKLTIKPITPMNMEFSMNQKTFRFLEFFFPIEKCCYMGNNKYENLDVKVNPFQDIAFHKKIYNIVYSSRRDLYEFKIDDLG